MCEPKMEIRKKINPKPLANKPQSPLSLSNIFLSFSPEKKPYNNPLFLSCSSFIFFVFFPPPHYHAHATIGVSTSHMPSSTVVTQLHGPQPSPLIAWS